MLRHVVLLKPKADVTEDELTTALEHVAALQDSIEGISAVTTGKNIGNWHQGFTHGFIMEFPDEACLRAYASHPAHQPVSQELQSLCDVIIDFNL